MYRKNRCFIILTNGGYFRFIRIALDPLYPVICFDELPCFLIADTVAPIPTQEGKVAKQHYAYEKNGSCCLLGAIEPLKGQRFTKVYPQRTKKEYTELMKELANYILMQSKFDWCKII